LDKGKTRKKKKKEEGAQQNGLFFCLNYIQIPPFALPLRWFVQLCVRQTPELFYFEYKGKGWYKYNSNCLTRAVFS
jgi:hypothetical protein